MKKIGLKDSSLFFIDIFIAGLLVNTVLAYPIIISEKGINHTTIKKLVYSIPEKYYKYVDNIEFKLNYGYCGVYDEFNQMKCRKGYAKARWDIFHHCYYGGITIYGDWTSNMLYSMLQHELGHIYELCELKRNTTSEEFAERFIIKKQ